jgi:hypothetical protein
MTQTELKVSARIKKILQDKVTEHNEDNPKYRATLSMLISCFNRGVGAYNTNPQSVRPTVTSSDQWALARVNGLLYALRTGKFKNKPYDTDLLPRNHPLSSRKNLAINSTPTAYTVDTEIESSKDSSSVSSTIQFQSDLDTDTGELEMVGEIDTGVNGTLKKGKYDDLNFSIPKGVKRQAEQGLALRKKFGRGGTSVGLATARYLVSNTKASPEKVRHIAKYFPRHEGDLSSQAHRDYIAGRTDRATNGWIAWKLWGGSSGRTWSEKLVRAMNKRDEKQTQ